VRNSGVEQWLTDRKSPLVGILEQLKLTTHSLILADPAVGKTLGLVPYLLEQGRYHGIERLVVAQPTIAAASGAYHNMLSLWGNYGRGLFGLAHLGYGENTAAPLLVASTGVVRSLILNQDLDPKTTILIFDEIHELQDWP